MSFPHLDARIAVAPTYPLDRPPTRAEVWARQHYIYNGHKTPEELKIFCRMEWVWRYVLWFNGRSWRKQPDWKEGDPVIEAGVPDLPVIESGTNVNKLVYDNLHRAERTTQ